MERLLITKLVRNGDRGDLFGKGHQYKDLTLFDLSDLAEVGIDYANLAQGVETPCRFYAYFTESDKLNKAGRPYRDVERLEAIAAPATVASTDTSGILAELRAIRGLLTVIAQGQGLQVPPTPEEPDGNGDQELDAAFPRFGDGSTVPDAALEYYNAHLEAEGTAPADLAALRAWAKAHKTNGKH